MSRGLGDVYKRQEELCDFSIRTDDMEEAVEQVKQLLSIEKIDRK